MDLIKKIMCDEKISNLWIFSNKYPNSWRILSRFPLLLDEDNIIDDYDIIEDDNIIEDKRFPRLLDGLKKKNTFENERKIKIKNSKTFIKIRGKQKFYFFILSDIL